MDKQKLIKQLSLIFIVIIGFILFNMSIYNLVTIKYINNYDENHREKSINLKEYLPFEESSKIVHKTSNIKITEDIPLIDGATALYPVYSSFVNALYSKETVKFDGKDFDKTSSIQKTGTTNAFKRVIDGEVDIIFCAQPSKKQLEYAASKNVELELIPIGKEAFVFIVNKNNPINDLSIDQIKQIYTGKINNWKDLGGEYTPIIALQRAEGSGSQTAMLSFMNGEEMERITQTILGRSIGYSFRYYVESIVKDGKLKMISINGITPNIENIQNNTYPIVDNFYMIYRKNNNNKNIKTIVDYILSQEGQDIIKEIGYVPINN